jgi:hypothetical protein
VQAGGNFRGFPVKQERFLEIPFVEGDVARVMACRQLRTRSLISDTIPPSNPGANNLRRPEF